MSDICENCCIRCMQTIMYDHWSIRPCDMIHVESIKCDKCKKN